MLLFYSPHNFSKMKQCCILCNYIRIGTPYIQYIVSFRCIAKCSVSVAPPEGIIQPSVFFISLPLQSYPRPLSKLLRRSLFFNQLCLPAIPVEAQVPDCRDEIRGTPLDLLSLIPRLWLVLLRWCCWGAETRWWWRQWRQRACPVHLAPTLVLHRVVVVGFDWLNKVDTGNMLQVQVVDATALPLDGVGWVIHRGQIHHCWE